MFMKIHASLMRMVRTQEGKKIYSCHFTVLMYVCYKSVTGCLLMNLNSLQKLSIFRKSMLRTEDVMV